MSTQVRKNIRDALAGNPDRFELGLIAAEFAANPTDDDFLARLGLTEIARAALLAGDTLEAVGAAGPYATPAQRRAWAAGRLSAAIAALPVAAELERERRAAAEREADLTRQLAAARLEIKAAWRASSASSNVPFRDPKSLHYGSGANRKH